MSKELSMVRCPFQQRTSPEMSSRLQLNAFLLEKPAVWIEYQSEVWKNGSLNEELLSICNDLLRTGTAPDQWRKSCIIPIPKKGDLGLPSNYRGISLTSTAAKIFNKMILLRIRPEIEKVLRKNQNGFRPGRSTITQVLSLRRLILKGLLRNSLLPSCC